MLRILILALLFTVFLQHSCLHVLCEEEDACTQGEYDTSSCQTEGVPYLCKAPLESSKTATCISSGLCCCESRDGLFSSACADDDVCCDGGCCDSNKSFCCGGGCCDLESETCCGGECVGKASNGITIAVPVAINISLTLMFYCMVMKANPDLRPGRFATFMLLLMIFGAIQVVVALSAWDCSTGLKVIVGIGGAEMAVGLFIAAIKMVQAKKAGMGLFAAFTLERVVVLAVNTEGQVLGVAVADNHTMQVAQTKLGGRSSYGNVPQIQA